jgi:hypothetical protein
MQRSAQAPEVKKRFTVAADFFAQALGRKKPKISSFFHTVPRSPRVHNLKELDLATARASDFWV